MKMKKLAAMAMAGLLTLSAAVTAAASEAETLSFDVFAILNGEYDLKDNITMQAALQEAGFEFNYTSVMGADLSEKRNLLLASGDYPDIFLKSGFTKDDLMKYGN